MSLRPREITGKEFRQINYRIRHIVSKLISLDHVDFREWNDRFQDVYALCVSFPKSFDEELYLSTEAYLVEHVKQLYEIAASSNEQLLVFYSEKWKAYSQGISYLTCLYKYLHFSLFGEHGRDETRWLLKKGVPQQGVHLMPIGKLGLVIWKRHMMEPLQRKLLHQLLDGIRLYRLGDFPNQSVFHGVMESFVQVGGYETDSLEFYRENFEKPFLEATINYYKQEASRLMQENNSSQYMEKVSLMLEEEDFRCRKYLHPSSYTKVTLECEQRFISDQLDFLLCEMKTMVKEENRKDLRHMYRLLRSSPSASEALIQEFQQYITKTGIEAINALGGDSITQAFIETFIALYDKFSSLVESVFSGDHHFVAALDKAASSIVNHDWYTKFRCQAPELLAKYCDCLLKKNAKMCSEDDVENKLNDAIAIFIYIDDKDVFQNFYMRCIAKRLIFKQSVSMDAEESMIKKLKETSGFDFTQKLHLMFNDVNISADLNSRFTEFKDSLNMEIGIGFSIHVLQAGAWPFVQSAISTFSIPQELEKSVKMFDCFYKTKFSGRKLTWLHHMGNAELKLCYLTKPYIVSMSTYQMAILLLFERTDVLTYGEISENTKLNEAQLPKQIKSLLESKLILSTDSEESFKAESSFSLNKKYTNKRTKFRLPLAAQKETTKEEVEKTHASVAAERKMFLNAAIVRVMKERKVLRHNILIQEVINQTKDRFVPDVSMIKKSIEELIEREYIERTPGSRDKYSYVA